MASLALLYAILKNHFLKDQYSVIIPISNLLQSLWDLLAYYFRSPASVGGRTLSKIFLTVLSCIDFYYMVKDEVNGVNNRPIFAYFVNIIANILGIIAGLKLLSPFWSKLLPL